jgi:O-methyltransferase
MKKLIQYIFSLAGLELKRAVRIKNIEHKSAEIIFYKDLQKDLKLDYNDEAFTQIQIVRKNTMMPYINLASLYAQVIYFEKNNIEGDFVECGVWKGGGIGLMALANLKHSTKRRNLHLFDIFDNIGEPDPELDGELVVQQVKELAGNLNLDIKGRLKPIEGIYDQFGGKGTLEENKHLLEDVIGYEKAKIHYHKGWFEETIPVDKKEIDKIAILRLDGDYYSSTKVCLENLYDKVVPNGLIIIDDYGTYKGCKNAVDEFRVANNIKSFMHYSNSDCRYWFKNNS